VRLHAERSPEQTAFYCKDAAITWSALDHRATALARWFLDQGLEPGDRIAVHAPNSIELVQVLLGLFRAGLVATTVNTRLKPGEILALFDHARPRMAFCDPALRPNLEQAGVACPIFDRLPEIARAATDPLPAIEPGAPAVIIYTSGTTARPKGVVHTQGSLFQKGVKSSGLSRGSAGSARLGFLPMMHVSGLWFLATSICQASPTVLLPRFEAAAALDAIEHFSVTAMGGLPTMILDLIEEQSVRPRRVSSLRWVISGGDVIAPALQDRFAELFGTELLELYGMTEMCAICINPSGAVRQGSAGVPLAGIEVRVVDDEGRPVAEGEVGEIALRGSSAFAGYWNDPEITAATVRDGWLHTGDLGCLDADGYVWFRGRKKELIIRCGSNISPQEVEDVLYRHPAVLEAGVIGVPCPTNGERVAAFVVLRDGHEADAETLRQFARQHIADYKAPEDVHFLSALPKNNVGKVQRRALRELV
jgi:long-chain acyl-CoA synthetase